MPPPSAPTRPAKSLYRISATAQGGAVATWIGDLAVLYHKGLPLALIYDKLLVARTHLNNSQNRKVAQWLYENHYPPLTTAFRTPDLESEVITYSLIALGNLPHAV